MESCELGNIAERWNNWPGMCGALGAISALGGKKPTTKSTIWRELENSCAYNPCKPEIPDRFVTSPRPWGELWHLSLLSQGLWCCNTPLPSLSPQVLLHLLRERSLDLGFLWVLRGEDLEIVLDLSLQLLTVLSAPSLKCLLRHL